MPSGGNHLLHSMLNSPEGPQRRAAAKRSAWIVGCSSMRQPEKREVQAQFFRAPCLRCSSASMHRKAKVSAVAGIGVGTLFLASFTERGVPAGSTRPVACAGIFVS